MLKRREEQRERVQKEANKGQWILLQPCPQAVSGEPGLTSEAASPLCGIHGRCLSFPEELSPHRMCLVVSSPHPKRRLSWLAASRVEGAVAQQSTECTGGTKRRACSVDRLSGGWTYYLGIEETPRSWPGFPCTQMYLDLVEGTGAFQRISFRFPCTTHPPYLLPKPWWTFHVMRQNNEVGLKQFWDSKSFKEMLEALKYCASLETPNPLQMRIFNPCDPRAMNHPPKAWPSACFTVSLAVEEGLSLWFSLRHTLSAQDFRERPFINHFLYPNLSLWHPAIHTVTRRWMSSCGYGWCHVAKHRVFLEFL